MRSEAINRYAIGGYDGLQYHTSIEAFDATVGKWRHVVNFTHGALDLQSTCMPMHMSTHMFTHMSAHMSAGMP